MAKFTRNHSLAFFSFTLALLILTLALPGRAQNANIAASFPDVAKVAADYPNDVERYVVLNFLWDVLHEKSATAPDAIAKRSTYYNAANAIHVKYQVMGGQPSTDFETQNLNLSRDRDFRQKILEKYHLASVPVEKPPTPSPAQTHSGSPTDSQIQMAFMKGAPFFVLGIFLMIPVARVCARNASRRTEVDPPPPNLAPDLPALPETLRVLNLPELQHSIDLISGIAFDKETTMHTTAFTATTPGQVYSIGNDVYSTPGQTRTTVSTTQEDLIWLRTTDNRETTWTFTGGTFKVHAGQIISVIFRRFGNSAKYLINYNHTTGQFEETPSPVYVASGGWGWLASTFVGSIPFGIGFAIILSLDPPDSFKGSGQFLGYIAEWIMGGIAAGIAAFLVVGGAVSRLQRQRYAQYKSQYLPGLRQFLQQSTAPLQKHFPPR